MSIILSQTETTYIVVYQNHSYSVTRMNDADFNQVSYDVFDEYGELIQGFLEEEIVTYLEENNPN